MAIWKLLTLKPIARGLAAGLLACLLALGTPVLAGETGTENPQYRAAAPLLKEGKFEDAWPKLVEAAKEEPDSLAVLSACAYCADKLGKVDHVRRIYGRMVEVGTALKDPTPAESDRLARAREALAALPEETASTEKPSAPPAAGSEKVADDQAAAPADIVVELDADKLSDPLETISRCNLRSSVFYPIVIEKKSVLPANAKGLKEARLQEVSIAKGRLERSRLILRDDNGDGSFTTDDTFTLDKSFAYAPLAAHLATSSGCYKVESLLENSKLTLRPVEASGKLTVDFKASGLEAHMVFASADTAFVGEGGSEAYKVLPGEYKLQYGLVRDKKADKPIAGIVPGKMQAVAVQADKAEKVRVGEDFVLEFVATRKGDKIAISPVDLKVYGRAGEQYVAYEIQGTPSVWIMDGKKEYPMGRFGFG